jgi:hypothetical protein
VSILSNEFRLAFNSRAESRSRAATKCQCHLVRIRLISNLLIRLLIYTYIWREMGLGGGVVVENTRLSYLGMKSISPGHRIVSVYSACAASGKSREIVSLLWQKSTRLSILFKKWRCTGSNCHIRFSGNNYNRERR